jgi:hypothetical protein
MSTVTHRFGYAIVRAGVYMTDPLNILYVYGSLEKALPQVTCANQMTPFQSGGRAIICLKDTILLDVCTLSG